MMEVFLTEMGREVDAFVERAEREWMVLLLGLSSVTNVRVMEAAKEVFEFFFFPTRCRG